MHNLARAFLLALAGAALTAAPASADCRPITTAERYDDADVVFDGVVVAPAEASVAHSTARFQVLRWIKGSGPPVVSVAAAAPPSLPAGDVPRLITDTTSIAPRPGEAWRIFGSSGSSAAGVLDTSICVGSASLGPLRGL